MRHFFVFIFSALFLFSSAYAGNDKLQLKDLGIGLEESKGDTTAQQELEIRSKKLQKHQIWGLTALGLMAATYLVADEVEEGSELHQYLGMATSAAYWTAFYYQYTAPKPKKMGSKGWNIRWHKRLAWIHAPLMILTPIAGILAWQAKKNDKEPTGLAAQKETLGQLTMASFGLAATLMIIDF